jgi:hypothetical protein
MDDWLPHIGLDPSNYGDRNAMLVVHGHQFDFWNCDEHNRVGKFIANAVGVPADAFDDVVYDFRGVDRLGHPLVELWDVLAPVTPWNNWPPEETAREWAEALENRPVVSNITVDSITFSETFAAVIALLMRSGPVAFSSFHPLLCIGHTHNPQSRPWIPYLNRFNPWRETEVLGVPVFENLFALKTRYLNSGTVSWWEHLIWAIEITPEGQPRLVYWAGEDSEPVTMDWELRHGSPVPSDPFAGILGWIEQYLGDDVRTGIAAIREALSAEDGGAPAAPAIAAEGPTAPGLADLVRLLGEPGTAPALAGDLPLTTRAVLAAALGGGRGVHDDVSLAALAARGHRSLRGADPRDWPQRVREAGTRPPDLPPSAALAQTLWPALLTGAPSRRSAALPDLRAVVRALFWSYSPGMPRWVGGPVDRAGTRVAGALARARGRPGARGCGRRAASGALGRRGAAAPGAGRTRRGTAGAAGGATGRRRRRHGADRQPVRAGGHRTRHLDGLVRARRQRARARRGRPHAPRAATRPGGGGRGEADGARRRGRADGDGVRRRRDGRRGDRHAGAATAFPCRVRKSSRKIQVVSRARRPVSAPIWPPLAILRLTSGALTSSCATR